MYRCIYECMECRQAGRQAGRPAGRPDWPSFRFPPPRHSLNSLTHSLTQGYVVAHTMKPRPFQSVYILRGASAVSSRSCAVRPASISMSTILSIISERRAAAPTLHPPICFLPRGFDSLAYVLSMKSHTSDVHPVSFGRLGNPFIWRKSFGDSAGFLGTCHGAPFPFYGFVRVPGEPFGREQTVSGISTLS